MDPAYHLQNVREAFARVTDRVNTALRTQIGDNQRLEAEREDVLLLLQALLDFVIYRWARQQHSI